MRRAILPRRGLLFGGLLLPLASTSAAEAEGEPESRVGQSLLRALAYDLNLKSRAADVVTIGVLYRASDRTSETARDAVGRALAALTREGSIAGLPTRTLAVPFDGALAQRLGDTRATAILVCPGLSTEIGYITAATRTRSTLSFSDNEAATQAGVSVGLVLNGSTLRLIINLPASRAEGVHFDPTLLKYAEIIR